MTILPKADVDDEATVLVNEDQIFQTLSFKVAYEGAAAAEEVPIPNIPTAVEAEIKEGAILVHDSLNSKPVFSWDKDNPHMYVGTLYPCMDEFTMVVRQHAIVNEFELGIEKSNK
jgi:hypothetical protein